MRDVGLWEQAQELLGVGPEVTTEQLRAAYLDKVRQHPPDRDPETFEKLRDAYDQLRDPRARAQRVLAAPDPDTPLPDVIQRTAPRRRYVGLRVWLDVLADKEKRP